MQKKAPKISSRIPKGAWLILLAVVAIFLWVGHRAHLLALLPTLLLFGLILICPLMHLFMHHQHGCNHKKRNKDENVDEDIT